MIFSRFAVARPIQLPATLNRLHTQRPYATALNQPPEDLEPDKADETQALPDESIGQAEVKATPKYISRGKLLAAHRARVVPELREEDLDETFVRGSGPGGQAINKTSSSVSLIHRPTGIRVQCQATRSREDNRRIARKILLEKLDQMANPGLSKQQLLQEKARSRKRQRAKKAKKKARAQAGDEPAEDEEADFETNMADNQVADSVQREK
ncbi:hypothetical protein BDV93DRAFT_550612 [Ceratobasidium sp. AG-I]|nr:hypothetical protein BDV93DRAFT_550612 [Ceratobasidium sp. AG-I]